ncbi:glucose 1-dehydrogenase [Emcibacter sp. SYSU 3D8]|uniref:SDR family NAD(P)-dependent oxidoreductase n=1 Tax=Emcibacter sp. SYSU 3D8 TaxID=3133969 RepID=UPI0031FE6013
MARLQGKVALISGGASGIGAAHVRLFAREGAKVVSGDINDDAGGQIVADANKAGGEAMFVHLDVTSADSWSAAVAAATARFGGLTTLVNNAGIYHPGGVSEETDAGWQRMIAINQTGVWYGMRAALPDLVKAGNGAVVNISSLYGMVGSPGSLSYHATKAAVRLMSKSAALEYVKQGVRVNTILPGQIRTPILGDLTPEMDAAIKASIPMGRMGDPEDIAWGSVYLCSDEAKYITGAELVIDAGWSIP